VGQGPALPLRQAGGSAADTQPEGVPSIEVEQILMATAEPEPEPEPAAIGAAPPGRDAVVLDAGALSSLAGRFMPCAEGEVLAVSPALTFRAPEQWDFNKCYERFFMVSGRSLTLCVTPAHAVGGVWAVARAAVPTTAG
jgi:hypothetical protein